MSGKFWERTKTDVGGNRTLTGTVFPRPWRFSTEWRFESPLVHPFRWILLIVMDFDVNDAEV